MKKQNKLNAIFIILVAIALGLACSSSNQIEEANKTVDQANKKLDEAKELYTKTESRNKELFSVNIQNDRQLQAYKFLKNNEAKSIVADYERTAEMLKDISKQYDDVSRMNLNEKYKEYAKLKSEEFVKRAEAVNIRKGNAQAFAEIDDPKTMTAKFEENNTKSDKLFKDAEDIAAKAKKIEDENKDVFKQT
ncbi:hypothetical protein BH10ACI1_BH10ACI1_34320 [soil metagenome]